DDPRVGIERGFGSRAEEQRLVEAVLALDGEGLQVTETKLCVERLGLVIVVQHREVEVGQTTAHALFYQVSHQRLADAWARAAWGYRQAPEAGAVFRIVEGLLVIDAHDAADHLAAVFILGQPVDRPAFLAWGTALGIDRQHAAGLIKAVDGLPVRFALHPADAEAAKASTRRAVVAKPDTQGVGGIEE